MTLLIGIQVALAGRLGGAVATVSAFFWSLLVLAFVCPWWQSVPGLEKVPGVLYPLVELTETVHDPLPVGLADRIWELARFLGYPALLLLILLAVQLRWGRGFRQISERLNSQVEVQVS